MRNFPLFVNMAGERVVIAGGGEDAARKARLLCRTEAEVVVMAPELCPELDARRAAGEISHISQVVDPETLSSRLVISATGCAGADAAIAALARDAGALVNVVDRPGLCNVTMPAIVDRDPVVIAIGTEGTAPVLARHIKSRIESMLEPGLGSFAAFAGRLRADVAQRIAPSQRRAFWAWVFRWGRARFATGAPDAARQAIRTALDTGGIPGDTARRISLIEVAPGASDLLTLRAVARLQEADLIVHDSHTDPEVLELARRDAERAAVSRIGDVGLITGKVADHDVVAILSGPSDAAGLVHGLGAAGLDVERIPAAAVAPRQVWRLAG